MERVNMILTFLLGKHLTMIFFALQMQELIMEQTCFLHGTVLYETKVSHQFLCYTPASIWHAHVGNVNIYYVFTMIHITPRFL